MKNISTHTYMQSKSTVHSDMYCLHVYVCISLYERVLLTNWCVTLQLLPIPDSLPISPDDGEHADIYKLRIRVRGNLEWAPPRPQIIFNIHPAPK